ncbi:MAG: histidine phosphatase family protein [Cytophagales bacterium]|nr:MAG: histidine phosphatase family protein [Cytophagales bacterium]TAF60939.1 MAG: histidine phosphatase family protein [Cytophagales bacterium]
MKTVYLLRHAKSSWRDIELDDFERPLNKRGKRDLPFMSELLAKKVDKIDCIVSSPALRTKNTAEVMAAHLSYPLEKIIWDLHIYNEDADYLYDLIKNLNDEDDSLLLVGHNPAITILANSLCISAYIDNMPTCCIYAISFDTTAWAEISSRNSQFLFAEFPKKYFPKDVE